MTTRDYQLLVKKLAERVYLGDGLFASYDGYQIRLAASDGVRDHDVVYLDPVTLTAFFRYNDNLNKLMKEYEYGNQGQTTDQENFSGTKDDGRAGRAGLD